MVSRKVLLICCEALAQRVRPAEPLKPGRDLGVVQIGIVAAVAADDLEHAPLGGTGTPLTRSPKRLPLTSRGSALLIATHLPVVLTTAGVWSSVFSNFL